MPCRWRWRTLWLEPLEDRFLPATITWINPAGGAWSDQANWDAGRVPTQDDDVIINLQGAVVTYDAGATTIRSLTCSSTLVFQSARLTTLTSATIHHLEMNGGTLSSGEGLLFTGMVHWVGGTLEAETTAEFHGVTLVAGNSAKTLGHATFINHGTWTWEQGRVRFRESASFVNSASGVVRLANGTLLSAQIENAGRWQVQTSGTIELTSFTNSGELHLLSGRLRALSFEQIAGSTLLSGGTLASSLVKLQGGLLAGAGKIEGSVDNYAALIAPGGGKILTIDGNFTQRSAGKLLITVQTPVARGNFDQLVVSGNANLGGMLDLRVYGPISAGDRYTPLQAGSISGTFADYAPRRVGSTSMQVEYSNSAVEVVAESRTTPPPRTPTSTNSTSNNSSSNANIYNSGAVRSSTLNVDPNSVTNGLPGAVQGDSGVADASRLSFASSVLAADVTRSLIANSGMLGLVLTGVNRGSETLTLSTDTSSPGTRWAFSSGALSSGERGAGSRGSESSGLAEEVQAALPLILPEVNLPSESEILVADDLAQMLLVGRPKANLVAQGGSQTVVATLVTEEAESRGDQQELSEFAGLLVNPLTLGYLPSATRASLEAVAFEPLPEEGFEERKSPVFTVRRGLTLALLVMTGLTLAAPLQAQKKRRRIQRPRRVR